MNFFRSVYSLLALTVYSYFLFQKILKKNLKNKKISQKIFMVNKPHGWTNILTCDSLWLGVQSAVSLKSVLFNKE